jgi:hypothetical protein
METLSLAQILYAFQANRLPVETGRTKVYDQDSWQDTPRCDVRIIYRGGVGKLTLYYYQGKLKWSAKRSSSRDRTCERLCRFMNAVIGSSK